MPKAQARWQDGKCQVERCSAGREDWNGLAADGCEDDLRSAQRCSNCDNDCGRVPNVERAIYCAGTCGALDGAPGFGDCTALSADGCERQLNREDDCDACGQHCQPAHSAAECTTGVCRHRACEPGYEECDGEAATGCESALDTPSHCGGWASRANAAPRARTASAAACVTPPARLVSSAATTAKISGPTES